MDVHPSGLSFVTAGNDAKIRIWALGPVLDPAQEGAGPAAHPRALAVLGDHAAAVNAVRFDGSGRGLASGSDDHLICLFELRGSGAGGGGGAAGGGGAIGEGPNLETWKVVHQLRGHTNNVTDVAWAPDDALVASASLDNTVVVWDPASGGRVARLEGHKSYVKGVAWDPVGTYLASQADDASVIIWRRDGWAPTARVTSPFTGGTVSSSFSLRLGWLPDGSALAACNAFDPAAGVHFSPIIARDTWKSDFSLVGHTGAVVVARPNPRLFRAPQDGRGDAPACLIAAGSQDHRLTVWRSSATKAVFVASKFFKQTVVDVAWTPDGYGLLAVSTDGSLAAFQFTEAELGAALSAEQAAQHAASLYGDASARTAAFAETAGQLVLEGGVNGGVGGGGGGGAAPAGARRPPVRPGLPTPPAPAALAGRFGTGSGSAAAPPAGSLDGRFAAASGGGLASRALPPPPARPPTGPAAMAVAAPAPADGGRRAGRGGSGRSALLLALPPALAALSVPIPADEEAVGGEEASPAAGAAAPPPPALPPAGVLEASNSTAALGQRPTVTLRASRGGALSWSDTLAGTAVALAASPCLAAAGLADGSVQVYSRAGRRLLPGVALGACSAFLAAAGPRLLLVTCDGAMRVWDFGGGGASGGPAPASSSPSEPVAGAVPTCVLEASVAPLLPAASGAAPGAPPGVAIAAMHLSPSTGLPLAVLTDMTAAAFHPALKAWLRVADTAFPASAYGVSGGKGSGVSDGGGELESVQAAAAGSAPLGTLAPMLARGSAADQSRAHLEANLASAAALASPGEYRGWLLAYVGHLAGAGDGGRLREVCDELLGPAGYGQGGGGAAWSPAFLGLDKRDLLRAALGVVGQHRALQRFAAEFSALLENAA